MEYMEVTDEWLYKYMPVVDRAIIKALESQVDNDYEFSERFERKMKKVIWKEAHPVLNGVQKIVKRAAAFLTGILCTGLILTMSVEAYREKFFETLKIMYEDSVLYTYSSNEKNTVIRITEPCYIPVGYEEIERLENNICANIFYENEKGEQITWEQMLINNGNSIVLDNEYDTEEERIINGHILTLFIYTDGYVMAYYEADNYAYLVTADHLTIDEICEIIASMDS